MSIINSIENEIEKARIIEEFTKNATLIRNAVEELRPVLGDLDNALPEPYKSDLAKVLEVFDTIDKLSHAVQTYAVVADPVATQQPVLDPPVDYQALAASANAAEINAAAAELTADDQ